MCSYEHMQYIRRFLALFASRSPRDQQLELPLGPARHMARRCSAGKRQRLPYSAPGPASAVPVRLSKFAVRISRSRPR